jgi:hypothetical protein
MFRRLGIRALAPCTVGVKMLSCRNVVHRNVGSAKAGRMAAATESTIRFGHDLLEYAVRKRFARSARLAFLCGPQRSSFCLCVESFWLQVIPAPEIRRVRQVTRQPVNPPAGSPWMKNEASLPPLAADPDAHAVCPAQPPGRHGQKKFADTEVRAISSRSAGLSSLFSSVSVSIGTKNSCACGS